jgi:hypothetical protein
VGYRGAKRGNRSVEDAMAYPEISDDFWKKVELNRPGFTNDQF